MRVILILAVVVTISVCGCSNLAPVSPGETCWLTTRSDPSNLFVARDLESFRSLSVYLTAKDKIGIDALISDGRVFTIETPCEAKIIEAALFIYSNLPSWQRVRILSGEFKDQEGWVTFGDGRENPWIQN